MGQLTDLVGRRVGKGVGEVVGIVGEVLGETVQLDAIGKAVIGTGDPVAAIEAVTVAIELVVDLRYPGAAAANTSPNRCKGYTQGEVTFLMSLTSKVS